MEKIYTYSVVRSTSVEFADRLPYLAAILEREDGSRFPAFVYGYAEGQPVEINMPVTAKTVEGGVEYWL